MKRTTKTQTTDDLVTLDMAPAAPETLYSIPGAPAGAKGVVGEYDPESDPVAIRARRYLASRSL